MKSIQSIVALMAFQGLANIAISALVLSETVVPLPTGFWYWCTGPLALFSGIVAILAARRNLRGEGRGLGLFALVLLGVSGVGTYKVPSGLIIGLVGTYVYLRRDTREAFGQGPGAQ